MDQPVIVRWIELLTAAVREGLAVGERTQWEELSEALLDPVAQRPAWKSTSIAPDPRPEVRAFLRYLSNLHVEGEAPAEPFVRLRNSADGSAADSTSSPERASPSTSDSMPLDAQPESWWYAQLVETHAAASHALLTGEQSILHFAQDRAKFIHAEIQPDHATGLPWAIHAFVITPGCEPTAEWILNSTMVQYAGAPRGLALVILSEALYCLRHAAERATDKSI